MRSFVIRPAVGPIGIHRRVRGGSWGRAAHCRRMWVRCRSGRVASVDAKIPAPESDTAVYRCRSALKSKNGKFIDIKSDNDGNKPALPQSWCRLQRPRDAVSERSEHLIRPLPIRKA
jgi:hypothetical protein